MRTKQGETRSDNPQGPKGSEATSNIAEIQGGALELQLEGCLPCRWGSGLGPMASTFVGAAPGSVSLLAWIGRSSIFFLTKKAQSPHLKLRCTSSLQAEPDVPSPFPKSLSIREREAEKGPMQPESGQLTMLCLRILWTTGVNTSMTTIDRGRSLQCCGQRRETVTMGWGVEAPCSLRCFPQFGRK